MNLGARYKNGDCEFVVWAPHLKELSLNLQNGSPSMIALQKDDWGYFKTTVKNIKPGTPYFYHLKDHDRPDPASFYQGKDVFGPSSVVDHSSFPWNDQQWNGIPLGKMI